jgi:prepilin-type N-terminal cleavage/methylation domain-containing protein
VVTRRCRTDGGFSLLQLLIAIAIIAILAVLVAGAVGGLRRRAHRIQCMANLKSLHAAVELYRQQKEQWPQVLVDRSADDAAEQYSMQWIAALEPFGASRKTWICPETQQLLGNPDYTNPELVRVDYFAHAFRR